MFFLLLGSQKNTFKAYQQLFTASTTWEVPHTGKYKILVVGGGGAGGPGAKHTIVYNPQDDSGISIGADGGNGGNGGNGGAVLETRKMKKGEKYRLVVGAGGSNGHSGLTPNAGGNSMFDNITARGGGAGGAGRVGTYRVSFSYSGGVKGATGATGASGGATALSVVNSDNDLKNSGVNLNYGGGGGGGAGGVTVSSSAFGGGAGSSGCVFIIAVR